MPIHQEVTIPATPQEVFDTLTDGERFARMTGGRGAEISKEAGGAFRMFGGDIVGRQIELIPGRRVVQAWRSGGWPEGIYSVVRFELSAEGAGTRLVFDQAGHPEGDQPMLSSGWQQMYWEPMIRVLGH